MIWLYFNNCEDYDPEVVKCILKAGFEFEKLLESENDEKMMKEI